MPSKPKALDLYCGAGGVTKGLQRAGFHVTGVDINPQARYCGDAFFQTDALNFQFSHTSEFVGGSCDYTPELCDHCGLHWNKHFDFVWASPPCQAFTGLRFLTPAKHRENFIPETRELLTKSGIPYCIENVPGAPLGANGYLIMLCGTMFGLQTADGRAELRRHRLFETSFSIPLRPACQHGTAKVLTVVGHTPVDNTSRHSITVTGTGMGPRISKARAITITGNTPQTDLVRNQVRETFTVQQAKEAMGIDWMPMSKLSQAIPPAYSEFIGREALSCIKCFP